MHALLTERVPKFAEYLKNLRYYVASFKSEHLGQYNRKPQLV